TFILHIRICRVKSFFAWRATKSGAWPSTCCKYATADVHSIGVMGMETIGERIKRLRQERDLSPEDLAKAIGKHRSTYYRYESDEIENMPMSVLTKLARALGVSEAYLLTGQDDSNLRTKRVPILGSVAAGEPILATEEYGDYVELGDDGIQVDFCLRVKGDSMRDARIMDGDLVFVRRQPTVQNGEIAVVLIDDEVTLKRVYITEQGIILKPENPAYQPMFVSHDDFHQVRILGRAVAFQSKL